LFTLYIASVYLVKAKTFVSDAIFVAV